MLINKKKISDLFLRKQDRQKKQKPKQEPESIDQTYFQCNMSWDRNLTIIKINAIIAKGQDAGLNVPLVCKWYYKTKTDFKEIEGVKASYYQPCLDDVGASICVHMQPHLQGKTYNGVTIIKETDILQISQKLLLQSKELLSRDKIIVRGKIQAIFSQNARFQFIEIPLQCEIVLQNRKIKIYRDSNNEEICQYDIIENYMQIEFIRKTFNSLIISLNDLQSMRISFADNFKRDLFALLIRNLTVDKNLQTKNNESDNNNEHQVQADRTSTLLVLKVDELTKQNQHLSRQYTELKNNYHIQRQTKLKLLEQLKELRIQNNNLKENNHDRNELAKKMQKNQQEHHFLSNQLSILKKQKKQLKEHNASLNEKIHSLNSQLQIHRKIEEQRNCQNATNSLEDKVKQLQYVIEVKDNQYTREIEKITQQTQQQESIIGQLKRKIQSLIQQKMLVSPSKQKNSSLLRQQQQKIETLQSQIINLQMLLKYKSNQKGNQAMNLHQIINRLTQNITQKQLQLESIKMINRQLMKKIQQKSKKQ